MHGEISGCQIEQQVDELILLANISATDPARLSLADPVCRRLFRDSILPPQPVYTIRWFARVFSGSPW
jgi:hypothetical protein